MAMSMFNHTRGICPPPFYQESVFPPTGGFVEGRFCQNIGNTNISCCLPCPLANWRYGDDVVEKTQIASWISVAMLPLCIFILISYAVLAPKWTHRHYTNIPLTAGIALMEVALIVPRGTKPQQCYNAITPNDMYSDMSCAWTGSLLLFGGLIVVIWSFIRTVAFHLHVCWGLMLGRKFMVGAFICGFGVPIIILTVMLIYTGVSYRFGTTCHINIKDSTKTYWYPLLAFAAAALVLQLATLGYCMYVYVKSAFDKSGSTGASSSLPSFSATTARPATARQAYRRIRRILHLQWRGVAIVLVIIGNVIFFAVVFVDLNNAVIQTPLNKKIAKPWVLCLLVNAGDRSKCTEEAAAIGPNGATLLAVLYLLSLVGLWVFLLFGRPLMFMGWVDLFKAKFIRRHEYISADARTRIPGVGTYEMLNNPRYPMKTPEPVVTSVSARAMSPDAPTNGTEYGRAARYVRPSMSFSAPKPPGTGTISPPPAAHRGWGDWNPEDSFARAQSPEGPGSYYQSRYP